MDHKNHTLTYIGNAVSRGRSQRFGIRQPDRLSHLYIIGKTGAGKSTLLFNMAKQDLIGGRGLCFVDPHGDTVSQLANLVGRSGRCDIIYWNIPDPACPYGYNPLRQVRADKIPLAVSGILESFKKIWSDAWGVRMEHILRNALYALLERQGSTLPDILRLVSDEGYRKQVARGLANDRVRTFWLEEFPKYSSGYRSDGIGPIQNKVGAFLADPVLNRILTAPAEDLHLRQVMDAGGVLLVNLAKGTLGEDSANLLGSLIISTIGLAAFSRGDMAASNRKPFFVYLDEFQSFATLSIANMTSELRKFGVGLILAHQHLHQLEPDVRHAILGNAGTIISFRLGPEDAPLLAREFSPTFDADDLLSLPNYHIYLKLMIDGMPSSAFSAITDVDAAIPRHADH